MPEVVAAYGGDGSAVKEFSVSNRPEGAVTILASVREPPVRVGPIAEKPCGADTALLDWLEKILHGLAERVADCWSYDRIPDPTVVGGKVAWDDGRVGAGFKGKTVGGSVGC